MVDQKEPRAKAITSLNIIDQPTDPGPRMGLGGWGMPDPESPKESAALGLIVGYCLEKITNQFALLRSLTVEGAELHKSLQFVSISQPGTQVKVPTPPKRKQADELLDKARQELPQNITESLNKLVIDEDILQALLFNKREELMKTLIAHKDQESPIYQRAMLFLLRNAKDKQEFHKLLHAAGGAEILKKQLRGYYLGAFYCMLERFEIEVWQVPYHHALFTTKPEELLPAAGNALEELQKQIDTQSRPLVQEDYIERFIYGDITASDMVGLTRDELYMIAKRGYALIQEGKLHQAKQIFDGLTYLDPYDPYFYTVLGSIRQKQEQADDAVLCYNVAIRLQPWNINALANRGEILLNQGKLTEALTDFQYVIQYEPDLNNENPSVVRTKALLFTIKELVDQKTQSN
jgi:tetratricopeptide (TPR) repeat protein